MIKPFRLQDIFLVANLQNQGLSLNLEERLIHANAPLRSALLAGFSPITPQVFTYLLNYSDKTEQIQGFVQTRTRPGRPEQDIVFISPSGERDSNVDAVWLRLLIHLVQRAGETGHYRIYAYVEASDSEALPFFKNVGFTPYAEEEFLRLFPTGPLHQAHHPLKLRKQKAADSWSLQRLYAAITPRTVQLAEGLAQGQWQVKNYLIDDLSLRRGFVWESQGEISAVLHIQTGKNGHLMKILVHPEASNQISNLVTTGLSLLKNYQQKPIYFNLRTYQVDLRTQLTDVGFTSFAKQVVMVKHTTVRAKDFLTRFVSAFEGSTEAQPQPASPTMIVPSRKFKINREA